MPGPYRYYPRVPLVPAEPLELHETELVSGPAAAHAPGSRAGHGASLIQINSDEDDVDADTDVDADSVGGAVDAQATEDEAEAEALFEAVRRAEHRDAIERIHAEGRSTDEMVSFPLSSPLFSPIAFCSQINVHSD
jgi:hypothetical protein